MRPPKREIRCYVCGDPGRAGASPGRYRAGRKTLPGQPTYFVSLDETGTGRVGGASPRQTPALPGLTVSRSDRTAGDHAGISSETLSEKKDRLGGDLLRQTEDAKQAEAEKAIQVADSFSFGLGEVQTEASR